MQRRMLLFAALLLFPIINTNGQALNSEQSKYMRASQEMESVLREAEEIDEPTSLISVKARAASVLWKQSPERARKMFLDLWEVIERENVKKFDRDGARLALLRRLYPKDRELAAQLLHKLDNAPTENKSSPLGGLTGSDARGERLADLAAKMLDDDPALVAQVLAQSAARGVFPMTQIVLSKLRDKDPTLANSIAGQILDALPRQSPTQAVTGAALLTGYLFPLNYSPAASPEVVVSDDELRARFTVVAYPILKASFAETDESLVKELRLSPQSLNLRTSEQAVVAATLAALAPRYAPRLAAPLNDATARLIVKLPPQIAKLVRTQALIAGEAIAGEASGEGAKDAKSDEPSSAEIIAATARGQFDDAEKLTDRIKDKQLNQTTQDWDTHAALNITSFGNCSKAFVTASSS